MHPNRAVAIFLIVLFFAACYFPLFMHLDHMSLRLWDEGRRSVNAFEMAQNGNLLVTHFEGKPEMWGTKPPLLIWCQAFLMKTIGYNEVAVRLPSALASLATIVLLILFCWKILQKPLAGFLAGLVLMTTKGYVGAHGARSGDFDSLLILWQTSYLLCFFVFFQNGLRRWLYRAAAFVALAGLTKGIAGFFFLPGVALYYLFSKKARLVTPLLTWWKQPSMLFGALALAFLPVLAFYVLREAANPGYLAAVMENEVGGRYLGTVDGHLHPWYHYFQWLYLEQFQPWLMFLPLALVCGFWFNDVTRRATAMLLFNVLVFLCIISAGQTRVMWYMAPVYPALALLTGIGFEKLVMGASALLPVKSRTLNPLLLFTFVIALFWQPYRQIIERVYFEQHPAWDWPELKFRDFMRQCKSEKTYTVVHAKYNSHVVFYSNVRNLEGSSIRHQALDDFEHNKFTFGKGPLDFAPGDLVMVCEESVTTALDAAYRYEVLRAWDTCKLVRIGRKVDNG